MICRSISSCISAELPSEPLSNDRRLDWCSICRACDLLSTSPIALPESAPTAALPSRRRLRASSGLLRCLASSSRVSRSLGLPPCRTLLSYEPPLGTPTSLKLSSLTSSIIRLSASSSLSSLFISNFGITLSPGVYFSLISSFSSTVFPRLGFAWRYISSKVVTVAFGRVSRTEARQDGQV